MDVQAGGERLPPTGAIMTLHLNCLDCMEHLTVKVSRRPAAKSLDWLDPIAIEDKKLVPA